MSLKAPSSHLYRLLLATPLSPGEGRWTKGVRGMVFLGKEKKWDTVEGKQVETPLLGTLCKDSEWDQLVRRHRAPGAQEAIRGKRWAGTRRSPRGSGHHSPGRARGPLTFIWGGRARLTSGQARRGRAGFQGTTPPPGLQRPACVTRKATPAPRSPGRKVLGADRLGTSVPGRAGGSGGLAPGTGVWGHAPSRGAVLQLCSFAAGARRP